MADEYSKKRPWWNNWIVNAIIAVVFITGFNIFEQSKSSSKEREQSISIEPPKPRIIELTRDFGIEMSKDFGYDFEVKLTYNPQTYYPGNDNELTDVDLLLTLRNKKTVNTQQKAATVARWQKGQSLTIEEFDTGVEGFDVDDLNSNLVIYEITGSAKSGDNLVKINQKSSH